MEIKKSPKANLENFKSSLTLFGILISLTVVYFVFTSSASSDQKDDIKSNTNVVMEEEQVQITKQEVVQAPPPQAQQQVSADVFQVVNNNVQLKDAFDFNMDVDKNMQVDFTDVDINANTNQEAEPEPVIFAEQMPEFPGGLDALKTWIAQNIQYPQLAQDNDIQGTVYLRFVVTSKGNVGEVQLIRGVHELLDKEAMRVVKLLPAFKPGMQGGRAVPVWYSVPIVFQLNN